MSFPKYRAYKPTCFSWLGDLPAHWEIKRLRYLMECLDGRRVPLNSVERASMQGNVPYWGANCVVDFVDQFLFDEELVLLGEDGAPFFEPNKTVAFVSRGQVWPNNHIHVLRIATTVTADFVGHLLNITDYAGFVNGSTRDKLTQSAMSEIPVPCPPLEEQIAISTFLHQETSKIDALISEQQRLICLLKEKRQAVISHAVTKGLNRDVRMKPSGVEWLGEVPEQWGVLTLKRLVSLKSGDTITSEVIDDVGEFPVFGGNGLRGYTSSYTHEGSFVLIGRQGALCGNVNFAEGKFYASEHAIVATQIRPLDTLWLGEMLRSMNLNQYSISAAQPGLSVQVIQNLQTIYPPIEEQRKISEFVRVEVARAEGLIGEASKAIALLQERRTALISAAVTGKIDVRNYAATQKDAA